MSNPWIRFRLGLLFVPQGLMIRDLTVFLRILNRREIFEANGGFVMARFGSGKLNASEGPFSEA